MNPISPLYGKAINENNGIQKTNGAGEISPEFGLANPLKKTRKLARAAAIAALVAIAGCTSSVDTSGKAPEKELSEQTASTVKAKGMRKNSPILIRIFKEEGVLEVWKEKENGRFGLAATYEICKWSGKLGPKFVEGDRQAPEGFYSVRPGQMNPNSSYHLSFNIGFPNAFDRVNGRYGNYLMVHGGCSSAGCYSMTDEQVEEIYAFARDAFRGGQKEFQVQAFPFRMTAANLSRYRNDPNYAFWTNLKEGYDYFEATKTPPKVAVCGKQYVFNRVALGNRSFHPSQPCPPSTQPEALQAAYTAYVQESAFTAMAGTVLGSEKSPTIAGIEEAALIADWSRRRAKGQPVTSQPPSIDGASKEQIEAAMAPVKKASARMAASSAYAQHRHRVQTAATAPSPVQRRF